jgi:hypothetical protein
MKELLKALEHNGFAKDTATLESVYGSLTTGARKKNLQDT